MLVLATCMQAVGTDHLLRAPGVAVRCGVHSDLLLHETSCMRPQAETAMAHLGSFVLRKSWLAQG